MHDMADEQYLTVYEAADRARVHHTTIRRAKAAREIEYVQSHPRAPIKISESALKAWIERQTKRPVLVGQGKHGSRALNRQRPAA